MKKFFLLALAIGAQLCPLPKLERKINPVGRFELFPYSDELKEISPASKYNVLDCYVIINNKTNFVLRMTLFQRKDYTNKASEIIPIQEGTASFYKLPRNKITGFALPRIKWCERLVIATGESRAPQTVETLKTAPIIGFSVSKPKDELPIIPEYLLPKDRPQCITYAYDIIPAENKNGFDVVQVMSQSKE